VPKPKPTEDRRTYISRAIPEFIREGYSLKEAQGRAYGFWKTYHKKRGKKGK